MKERIEKIIEKEGMPQAKFAEEIGIQRSALSHILTGRNNASLEVLKKILVRFDYIDSEWLIFGKGSMSRSDKTNAQPLLFSEEEEFEVIKPTRSEYSMVSEVKTPAPTVRPAEKEEIVIKNIPARKVAKILLFYSDDTYDTFVSEKGVK